MKNIADNTLKYVFVHGAWHGSWSFYKTLLSLKNKNINAYAHDLPGHHKNNVDFKNITLNSYVESLSKFIDSIEGKAILVGHSMGGAVISQVAENIPSKIAHLVYIAGFIPAKHGSIIEEEKKAIFPSVALKVKVDEANCKIMLSKDDFPDLFYNTCSKENIEFALARIQDQPLLPFIQNVKLDANFDITPKTYIKCLRDNAIHKVDQERMSIVCKRVVEIDSDHSPFFSANDRLCEILGDIYESYNDQASSSS